MGQRNIIGARQMKAARALLDWSQDDLAKATQLSVATIRKLELGYISPRLTTTSVIRLALEGAGLEFIEPEGVRRRPDEITTYQGANGRIALLEDMYQTIKRIGGDIVLIETSEAALLQWQQADACSCFERILELNTTTMINGLLTDVAEIPLSTPRLEYRFVSKHYVDPMPFCVYGDKFAMIVSGKGSETKILVMRSQSAAQASRRHFYSIWEKATPFSLAHAQGDKTVKIRRA